LTATITEGMLLGRYRLLRLLARGGMGAVWVARDERLDREVAIKVLPQMLVSDQAARQRFEREARAMARILHPNVVPVFDVGSADPATGEELPYIVMELVRGTSLDRLLVDGPLALHRAVALAEQVARALSAAHSAGIVHRDLKPSNVMVIADDFVKVFDFGLARLLRAEDRPMEETLTQPGMVLGSCPYMSPEQALGDAVGPRTDVFSCGTVLYEMLTGKRAFTGETPVGVLQKVARAEYMPVEACAVDVPAELAAVVGRCLEREPGRRYADGGELARDLAAVHETLGARLDRTPTRRVSSARVSALRQRRRRRGAVIVAVTAAALAIGLLAGGVLGRRGTEARRPDPGAWRPRQLLELSGALWHPTWSPGGDTLVVEHMIGNRGELLAVSAEGGAPRLIERARPGEILAWPRFSPDGSALAVTAVGSESQRLEVIPAVGGAALAAVENASRGVWLDREHVLFSRVENGVGSLWLLEPGSGAVSSYLGGGQELSWWGALPRPGGGLALLGGPSDTQAGVFVTAAGQADGPRRQWLAPGRSLGGVSWASGGRSMAAVVDGRLLRLTESGATAVMPALENLVHPVFDPSGTRLAMVRTRTFNELVSVDPMGGAWTCRLCGVIGAGWGSVAGDGAMVYRRTAAGRRVLVLHGKDGRERLLLSERETGSCPAFSPEGQRVAYLAPGDGGVTELHVVSRSGGHPVALARGVEASEFPSWSPDGRFLAYAAGSPTAVWVVSAAGGTPRQLTPGGGDYPRWSPNGKWIAYVVWTDASDPNQGAWVVSPEGGEPRRIGDYSTQLAWRPDGGALWQVRRGRDHLELWEARPGSWRWRKRSTLDIGAEPAPQAEHLPLTVNPATGRLIMNRRSSTGELLVLEGIDPARW